MSGTTCSTNHRDDHHARDDSGSHDGNGALRPLVIAETPTKAKSSSIVSPSPTRNNIPKGRLSPGSPMAQMDSITFNKGSEYTIAYPAHDVTRPERSTVRGNANTAELWLAVGKDKYATESRTAFPGYIPPPAVARPVPKWEPNGLPFHGDTTYTAAFVGTAGGRPDIHKPQAQTIKLPLPLSGETEYGARFKPREGSPTKAHRPIEHKAAARPLYALSQYSESFGAGGSTGPLAATLTAHSPGAAPQFSPLKFGATKKSQPSSGPEKTVGFAIPGKLAAAAKAAPAASQQKRTHMAPTTAYSDIDGVGADPWKLAELLGFNGAK